MFENNHRDFKEQLTEKLDIEKEVIAFLNSIEGGSIYIGIADNGNIVGVLNFDKDALKIKDRIKNNILPSPMGLFDIVHEVREEKNLIKIIIAGGAEKPYFKKKYGMTPKGCYIRVGTSTKPMPLSKIEHLFSKRTKNSIGKIKSQRQDLTFEQLRIYYEEKKKPLNKRL